MTRDGSFCKGMGRVSDRCNLTVQRAREASPSERSLSKVVEDRCYKLKVSHRMCVLESSTIPCWRRSPAGNGHPTSIDDSYYKSQISTSQTCWIRYEIDNPVLMWPSWGTRRLSSQKLNHTRRGPPATMAALQFHNSADTIYRQSRALDLHYPTLARSRSSTERLTAHHVHACSNPMQEHFGAPLPEAIQTRLIKGQLYKWRTSHCKDSMNIEQSGWLTP